MSEGLDAVAEGYVRLVLALGLHDPDYVDAYHGPAEWREQVAGEAPALPEIGRRARELLAVLASLASDSAGTPGGDSEADLRLLRHRYLAAHLAALETRSRMLEGEPLSFDEACRGLYGTTVRRYEDAEFLAVLERLDRRLVEEGFAGGSLAERLGFFRSRFTVPPDKIDTVFRTALAAARERTAAHLELPAEERFRVEYVEEPPWSAYNWYQGRYGSLIQVNVRLPMRALPLLGLACHEGYPGHHVHHSMIERHLLRGRGWVEHSLHALFSPGALTAEGVATQARQMAFPDTECLALLREELFPRAGLDPRQADLYLELSTLQEDLAAAGTEAARRLLDGELDDGECARWLVRHAILGPERAARAARFYRRYGAYAVTYFRGRELLRAHLDEARSEADRWRRFQRVLTTPLLLPDLRPTGSPRGRGAPG